MNRYFFGTYYVLTRGAWKPGVQRVLRQMGRHTHLPTHTHIDSPRPPECDPWDSKGRQ